MEQATTERVLAAHPWEDGWEEQTEERGARQTQALQTLLAKRERNAPVALFGRLRR